MPKTLDQLPVKILAIGAGGLQRALTHEFVHQLNQLKIYHGGIFIGQPRGSEKAEAFNQQQGIYHVVVFDLEGIKGIQRIESVVGASTLTSESGREVFYAHTETELDLILVGVTEAGIAPGEMAMDVLDETLFRYFSRHGIDSTICVINTDNIRNNGHIIQNILINEYPLRSTEYSDWLSQNVGFLDEMGDRIVPQSHDVPEEMQQEVAERIGRQDELITYTEKMPSICLVIQDEHQMLRVPFADLIDSGVVVTIESIDPHHDWKLLLINSVHVPGITHKGMLSGIEMVNDAANHGVFGPHLERLMDGYARIVEADIPIPGRSAHNYSLEFINRIRQMRDSNARINIIETIKLRERAADIIKSPNYHSATDSFKDEFAYSVATVLRFLTPVNTNDQTYTGKTDLGINYEIKDPNRAIQDTLNGAFGTNLSDVETRMQQIFANTNHWTPPSGTQQVDLSKNQDFMTRINRFYHKLVNGETCLSLLEQISP
ncbi:MAG: hypothetical protein VYE00_16680 [Candidatus Poribacteria bacterium]|nr:hypothetical protein [Candidatus Poribacteria bacterium]